MMPVVQLGQFTPGGKEPRQTIGRRLSVLNVFPAIKSGHWAVNTRHCRLPRMLSLRPYGWFLENSYRKPPNYTFKNTKENAWAWFLNVRFSRCQTRWTLSSDETAGPAFNLRASHRQVIGAFKRLREIVYVVPDICKRFAISGDTGTTWASFHTVFVAVSKKKCYAVTRLTGDEQR